MSKKIKVVLSGAGLLYPLHAGAVAYLMENGYEIEHITGVSGGAIIAALVAVGYDHREIKELVLDLLPGPNKLLDFSWKPWWDWGLIKGERIEAAMRETFVDMKMADTKIPANIATVNLDHVGNWGVHHMIYSPEHTPEMDLAKAVRASISIPFVFRPVRINGHRHIDGGVAASFPLDIYGTGEDVIGFQIRPWSAPAKPASLFDYATDVISIMMDALSREHIEDAIFARMIQLDHKGGALNFQMNREEALDLFNAGYAQAKKALES